MGVPLSIFNGFLIQFYDYTGQRNEIFFFYTDMKPVLSVQFWVADSEPGIRFSPSRQNFAVLPISWLPGPKISFSRFVKKL